MVEYMVAVGVVTTGYGVAMLIAAGVVVAMIGIGKAVIRFSPNGYEDATGFHFGEPPEGGVRKAA